METSQAYNCNPIYVSTAPSSPSRFSRHQNMVQFYSARTSPNRMGTVVEEETTNFNDFEFETSKRFMPSVQTPEIFVPMAFADELISNGQVVPLKPPPRLSYCPSLNGTSDHRSSSSAASSPKPVPKIPFPRWKSTWSDAFDPFAVALEKVTEEKREERHHHRRSRSLSPFRTTIFPPLLQDQNKQGNPPSLELVKHQMVVRPTGPPNKRKGYLPFGKKVRPMKLGNEEGERTESIFGGNREQKGKGFLGRENNEVKVMKEQVAALWKKLRSFSEAPNKRRGRN